MIDIKLPIKELGLNTRALNWLKVEANIKTIEDLILHESMLLKYPNIGNVTNDHIKEKLAIHNLYLKTDRKFLKKEKKKMTDSRPYVRELTEWEIKECWEEATEMREHFCSQYFDFAQLILKKAREK
jgi:hypothetical protein